MQIVRCSILLMASAVFVFSMSYPAVSQEKESDGAQTEIRGCLSKGVEAGCLVLTTNDGKTYSLHGTNLPGLDKKLVVAVKGKEGGVDHCMQGTVFQVSSWNWTRMKCTKPAQSSGETKPN